MKKLEWNLEERANVQEILANETLIHISGEEQTEFLLESLKSNTTISEAVFEELSFEYFDDLKTLLYTNKTIKSVEFIFCEYIEELFYELDWDLVEITELTLDQCDFEESFYRIGSCKSLKNLVVKNTFLPVNELLSVILSSQIDCLTFESRKLSLRELDAIADAIASTGRFVSVNLTETCKVTGAIQPIGRLLATKIEKLKIGPFKTDTKFGSPTAPTPKTIQFAKKFHGSHLKSLSIYDIHLPEQFFLHIDSSFDNLVKLRLDKCSIDDSSALYIAQLASKNVLELDLSRNRIGNHGLERIVNSIISNEHFHTLDITDNEFNEEGFPHLTRLLIESKVRKLILDGNRITRKAMGHLANGLKNNKALYSLYMEGCDYEVEDMQILMESLYKHKFLFGIYTNMKNKPRLVSQNEVSEVAKQIGSLLKHNRSIRQIGCNLPGLVEQVFVEFTGALIEIEQEPVTELEYLLSSIQDNYSVTWIGEPNEYYYDDKKRYSDMQEYNHLVPITKRNHLLQTKRAKEFFVSVRKYMLLDLPNDLIYYMINRSFVWAFIHPRYQTTVVKCLANRQYIGKVIGNARFTPAVLFDVCSQLTSTSQ
ncbi:hypothetical protein HDV06_003771 [Boothiomyces sp. JEL0866]|nr:hypothetical protein HDV06_003771 [Boothiomyces sp. JEL0866]